MAMIEITLSPALQTFFLISYDKIQTKNRINFWRADNYLRCTFNWRRKIDVNCKLRKM